VAEKIIHISVSEETGLTFAPSPNIDLDDGDQVRWIFPDLPSNQFGFVFFTPRLGPFHSLRSISNTEILGKGNIGTASKKLYGYTAMILELGRGNPITTGKGTVNNRGTRVNTTPDVLVTYHPPANGEPATLTVDPLVLTLNPGDTATWSFLDLPDGAFADFQFDLESSGMKEATGPFVAFYACNGSDAVTVLANGTGFVATVPRTAWVCRYRYHIEVRNADGKLIGSHDPLIDTLGIPPTL
jgi:hypothetical protein